MSTLDKYSFEVKGSMLSSAYGVYIIEISFVEEKLYYVGQTGDAKHISARSPFYRFAAHIQHLEKSTQNQLNNGIRSYFNLNTQKEVEEKLKQATIAVHFYKTDDFIFENEKERHHILRRKTLALETALLQILKEKNVGLLNKTLVSFKEYKAMIQITEDIINEIGIEL